MWRRALQQPTPHVRSLCAGASSDNPIERLLKLASRPKMGLAKAKQSAGQRAIDLSKYTAKFEGMSFQELLQVNGPKLNELGLPVQDRKRLLKFVHKARQGWEHDGRERSKHAWKGWKPPEWSSSDRSVNRTSS